MNANLCAKHGTYSWPPAGIPDSVKLAGPRCPTCFAPPLPAPEKPLRPGWKERFLRLWQAAPESKKPNLERRLFLRAGYMVTAAGLLMPKAVIAAPAKVEVPYTVALWSFPQNVSDKKSDWKQVAINFNVSDIWIDSPRNPSPDFQISIGQVGKISGEFGIIELTESKWELIE